MDSVLILRVFVLLALANGAPVIASRLMGRTAAWPLDFGRKLADGRPIFGSSKTIRGLCAAVAAAAGVAPLLGLSWRVGAVTAAASMAGDLLSSFIKRRLALPSSSRALGLDQIPESLFGALAAQLYLPLTWADVAVATIAFFFGQVIVSRVFYAIGLRKAPH